MTATCPECGQEFELLPETTECEHCQYPLEQEFMAGNVYYCLSLEDE